MIQLHILLMKHEPKSRFQSSTNIPSNLLCKHLSWNPDNKELTFNAFITFASWNRKKKEKCYASTGSSSLWKSNAKSKYGIPSHGPVVFFSFPIELKKKKGYTWILNKFFKNALQKEKSYIFLPVFKVPDFMHGVH